VSNPPRQIYPDKTIKSVTTIKFPHTYTTQHTHSCLYHIIAETKNTKEEKKNGFSRLKQDLGKITATLHTHNHCYRYAYLDTLVFHNPCNTTDTNRTDKNQILMVRKLQFFRPSGTHYFSYEMESTNHI